MRNEESLVDVDDCVALDLDPAPNQHEAVHRRGSLR